MNLQIDLLKFVYVFGNMIVKEEHLAEKQTVLTFDLTHNKSSIYFVFRSEHRLY